MCSFLSPYSKIKERKAFDYYNTKAENISMAQQPVEPLDIK